MKSGSDFRYVSRILVTINPDRTIDTDVHLIEVTKAIQPDEKVGALVDLVISELPQRVQKVVGHLSAPLDARFSRLRTQETSGGALRTVSL